MRTTQLAVAVVALAFSAQAFYLPGAAPHDYRKGEPVDLFVNALTPMLSGSANSKLVIYSHYSLEKNFLISVYRNHS